jgi:iron complex outermembrane receptor protein
MGAKGVGVILTLVTMVTLGQLTAGGAAPTDEGELDLETLLDGEIETSIGRIKQPTTDVAGALTVLRGEELRQRGYTSLAQALRSVPGLYAVSDLATVNLGVRGVMGSAGSAGNLVKVLIDGNPVSFLPTNGNFFTEELIPLDVVERIEVVRSPSSALFGANAFLGVINIVTRSGDALRTGALLSGAVGALRNRLQYGGTATVSAVGEGFEALVSYQQYRQDRSGLALPPSSPALQRAGAVPAAPTSVRDLANPSSVFGRATLTEFFGGRLSLVATQQRLDSGAQFLGFAPLRQASRLTLLNQSLRLQDERRLGKRVELRTGLGLRNSRYEPSTAFDLGDEGQVLEAEGGAFGFEASAEATVRLLEHATLSLGADFSRDEHSVLGYALERTSPLLRSDGTVALPTGSLTERDPDLKRLLWNVGGFAQAVVKLGDLVSLTAGARVDGHNIYGVHLSPRFGAVLARRGLPFSAKLLFGSAFKAPSAVELYGRPLTAFDLVGNPQLKPQYARSFELVASYRAPLLWAAQVSLFATHVDQLVQYQQTSRYFEARNASQAWSLGGEAELEWTPLKALSLKGSLSLAQPVITTGDALRPPMPIYPGVQGHLAADAALPWVSGLHLSAELSVVGPRLASESNAIEQFRSYALPAHALLSASCTLLDQRWLGTRKTSLRLRVDNVLGSAVADPGYGGVDLPTPGRLVLFTVTQEL